MGKERTATSTEALTTSESEADGGGERKPVDYHNPDAPPLETFVKRVKDGGVKMLLDEFKALKRANQGIAKHTTKAFDANLLRNRYKDVGCWDQSRVVLAKRTPNYIHANFVDGAMKPKQFIATQGPIEMVAGQFEATVGDFWEMIWQERVGVIVMLCQTTEGGKAKCAQYWNEKVGERAQYGEVVVETIDFAHRKIQDHDIAVTTLELLKDGCTNTRSVVHFLHSNWPDRKCPPSAYPIVEFVIRVHTAHKKVCENNTVEPEKSPITVHCSAGIGRSGTFLAIDIALGLLNRYNALDIKEMVRLIRTQRHFAVQTPVQYLCVYQAILEFLCKHKGVKFDIAKFTKDVQGVK